MISSILLGMVLSAVTWFHNMVTLPSGLVSADFCTCSQHYSFSKFTGFIIMILFFNGF
jgi:hypothetical protein